MVQFMKPFKFAALVVACSFVLPSTAQTVDPLWAKTLAHAALVKKWVPEDTVTKVDATGEGKRERAKVKSHLKGWEDSKPVYDSVQVEPPPEVGKSTPKGKIEMSDAENMGEQLMRLDAPVRRTDGQVLDGKSWTTFDLAESKGPVKVSVRLWVDPLTGVAHQVESKLHGTLMFDMFLTTIYAPHKQAGSLPKRSDFKINVLVPFVDAKVNITRSTDNWIPRPN